MFRNILIGVDGSVHSLKAARMAGELARCTGANLWVIACFEPIPIHLGQPFLDEVIKTGICDAEKHMETALEEIGEIPGNLRTEVIEGPPAAAILSVAEVRGIDLILMGTRGLGRLSSLLLGSQSQKVVAQAGCPVMLVR